MHSLLLVEEESKTSRGWKYKQVKIVKEENKLEIKKNTTIKQVQFFDIMENEKNEKETKVDFKIISSNKTNDLRLSYVQIVTLLEGLYNLKEDIKKLKDGEGDSKFRHELKIEEITKLFNYLEGGIKCDFEGQANKCLNRWAKEKKKDDPGMETMSWLAK